jgi:peptidyl-prolyl cis-trans isomerase B (cyclophilin B)
MTSSNKRDRELARLKRSRQIEKAEQRIQRKRQLSLSVIIGGAFVVVAGFLFFNSGRDVAVPSASPTPTVTASPTPTPSALEICADGEIPTPNQNPEQWSEAPAASINSGNATWNLTTNCGDIVIELLPSLAPQTVSSMAFLTEAGYFNNTLCHRMTTQGLFVLQCGDPTATGAGGPGYQFKDENLPEEAQNNYPRGTVAMANSGPGTNGSQFFIVFADTTLGANYTIFGRVVEGLDIVEEIAQLGTNNVNNVGDGNPIQPIGIVSAEVVKG